MKPGNLDFSKRILCNLIGRFFDWTFGGHYDGHNQNDMS